MLFFPAGLYTSGKPKLITIKYINIFNLRNQTNDSMFLFHIKSKTINTLMYIEGIMVNEAIQYLGKVISRNRVTIPDPVVNFLQIKEGDFVTIHIQKIQKEKKTHLEEKFKKIKNKLNINDDRAKHEVAGIILKNHEEMDIGV